MNFITKPLINFIYETEEYIDSSGRISALFSFVLGTLLLLMYLLFKEEVLIMVGIFYVLFCMAINTIILLILIIKFFTKAFKDQSIKAHITTLIVMVLNIPIAFLYILIVVDEF